MHILAMLVIVRAAGLAGFGLVAAQPVPVMPLAALTQGALPDGFTAARTGHGAMSAWSVVADPGVPGGIALAQTSADPTDYRYPLSILAAPVAANLDVTVRFKPVSGRTDQAGGLAIRLSDPENYIVARANALEDNVNLYRVVKGDRREIKGARAKVASGEWHTLGLRAEGDTFTVSFDGKVLFTARDHSIAGPGRVALWTKADSVTRFDALSVRVLP